MRYAVIDIGSNTVRMVVCEQKDGKVEISGNERVASIILRCVKNGRLSLEGINFIIDTVNHMKSRCGEVDNIFAFATASLRSIDNAPEVCRIVEESTGVAVRLISGEEEAEYDFYSLRFLDKTKEDGIGLDLGGGSCQLFSFGNNELKNRISLLIGSARMHDKFVEKNIPTPKEAQAIYEYICKQISEYPDFSGYRNIYAIGGSARCAVALYNIIFEDKIYNEISVSQMEKLYKYMIDSPDAAEKLLNDKFPDRLYSLIPGIITLYAICRTVGAEKLMIAVCGVREGFIYKEIL